MAVSSAFRLGLLRSKNAKLVNAVSKRNSHSAMEGPDKFYGSYRADVPPQTYGPQVRILRCMQVFIWFHIFYSFWYDPGLMLGHPQFFRPDPSMWTDEQLGILPDDYDEEV